MGKPKAVVKGSVRRKSQLEKSLTKVKPINLSDQNPKDFQLTGYIASKPDGSRDMTMRNLKTREEKFLSDVIQTWKCPICGAKMSDDQLVCHEHI